MLQFIVQAYKMRNLNYSIFDYLPYEVIDKRSTYKLPADF